MVQTGIATVISHNSIFAENGDDDYAGTGIANYCLFQNAPTATLSGSNNLVVVDPGLDPNGLQNNGGPTETIKLVAGSPAIDAGSNALIAIDPTTGQPLATDQRGPGFPRISNGRVDIGAYETQATVAATTTLLTSSANPSVRGQAVTFTATVSSNTSETGTPGGSVDLFDTTTSVDLGTISLTGGEATLKTSALGVGNHVIQATYSGESDFTTSFASLTQTVNRDGASIQLTTSANPSSFGLAVTFTAKLLADPPGSGIPTGSIDFFNTTTGLDLGTVGITDGVASLKTSSLPVGANMIAARYSGDANFLKSAAAYTATVNPSIIVLDPTASGALSASGSARIQIPGVIYVDSSSSSALSASGTAQIKAAAIDVHGNVQKSGSASLTPKPITGATILADPLGALALPIKVGMQNRGSERLSGNSAATIQPGIYTQIAVSGNAKLTLSSGVYIMEGGGFSVSGNASVNGSGVMIVNAGSKYPSPGGSYGTIMLSGTGTYNLSPMSTGMYAGMVLFQPHDNSSTLSIGGNASGITGVIYAPDAKLTESTGAQPSAAIVVLELAVSGAGAAASSSVVDLALADLSALDAGPDSWVGPTPFQNASTASGYQASGFLAAALRAAAPVQDALRPKLASLPLS